MKPRLPNGQARNVSTEIEAKCNQCRYRFWAKNQHQGNRCPKCFGRVMLTGRMRLAA